MLESLRLKGAPAFDPSVGATIGPLKPVNFIFGTNGSGKTTISRAFADPTRFAGTVHEWASPAGTHCIKVYNRDYVDATLKQAANLPGVFLLGKTSAEIQEEIDGLTGPSGSIAASNKRLDQLRESLDVKATEIAGVRDELKDAAWSKRSDVPAELQEMFRGFKNSKENLLTRLLEIADANADATEDFDSLKSEAAAVLAEDAVQLAELPLGRPVRLEAVPGFDLFAIPVVGSRDVHLAPLIQHLRNADWVQHGQQYLHPADGLCPFCQQTVPADFAEQLDAYFDMRYTQQIEQLKALQEHVQTWADGWRAYFESVGGTPHLTDHLNIERFQAARAQLEQAIEHLTSMIATKVNGPSAIVTLEPPTSEVDSVNAMVSEANASIGLFNQRLQNRAAARKALLSRCWVVFARQTLATDLGRFEGAMPPLVKGRVGLEGAITAITTDLRTKEGRLRELQAQVTSSKPIIQTINGLLASVGFHSFRLEESTAVQDGYSLVREDGAIAADSLSEGERTFITFLYFAQSLQGTPQNSGEPNDVVAVIDDPISSLDSDVVFAVSTIIRRIVSDIAAGTARVRQLVLLTHNAHFHKEVTHKAQGEKGGDWQYGIVRKRRGRPSEVVLTKENPIQTAYGALWNEVRRAAKDHPSASAVSLQNTLRRILETYFKVLGGIDNAALIAKFDGDDQTICRALFAWINAGSHSIFDDLDYSHTPATIEANLRVFRRIFEEQKQEGHYLMMMRESADEPTAGRNNAEKQITPASITGSNPR
jgi:wobble nucleotide-excising tRNase